jgi:hypothetical protein
MKTINEIIDDLRSHTDRGELYTYLNGIADELEHHTWVPVEKQEMPDEPAQYYSVILQDGKVYEAHLGRYANGTFWEFSDAVKRRMSVLGYGKPKVMAWHPVEDPYLPTLDKPEEKELEEYE